MAIIEDSSSPTGYRDNISGRFAKAVKQPSQDKTTTTQDPNQTTQAPSTLGAIAGPIVASLRSEFKGLNTHLAYRFTDIKEAIIGGSPQEIRDEKIKEEEIKLKPTVAETPAEGKGILDTLRNLNPFKDGIGTKMTILLLVGALAAITQFEDKLIKPLSSFLKWADGDDPAGGLKVKVQEFRDFMQKEVEEFLASFEDLKASFKKMVKDIQTLTGLESWDDLMMAMGNMKARFTYVANDIQIEMQLFKQWWAPKWATFKSMFKLLEDMFDDIGEWVKSYDVGGPGDANTPDGILQKTELERIAADVKTKVVKIISDIFNAAFDILQLAFFATLVVGPIAMAAAKASWAAMVLSVSPLLGSVAGAPKPKGGFRGFAGMAALIVMGIWKLTDDVMTAWQQALEDEEGNQKDLSGKTFGEVFEAFDVSKFISAFFAGEDEEGGFMNALGNAVNKAWIVALGTASVMFLVGGLAISAISWPVVIIGAIIGAIGGYLLGNMGSEDLDKWFTEIGDAISRTVDAITGFFSRLFLRIRAFFTPGIRTQDVMRAEKRARGTQTAEAKMLDNARVIAESEKNIEYIQQSKYGSFEGYKTALSSGTMLPEDTFALANYSNMITEAEEENLMLAKALSSGVLADNEAIAKAVMLNFGEGRDLGPQKYQQLSPELLEALGMTPIVINQETNNSDSLNVDQILGASLGVDGTEQTQMKLNSAFYSFSAAMSDVRLKEDIKLVGKSPSNIDIYEFKYKGKEGVYQGVMAQEVPWATIVHNSGYLMVDYSKVDVEFKKLH